MKELMFENVLRKEYIYDNMITDFLTFVEQIKGETVGIGRNI